MEEYTNYINYWLEILELTGWCVNTESIDREQVMFPEDISKEDRYYVGILSEQNEAVIYHDRDLVEEDILHELLHLRFKKFSEPTINSLTRILLNVANTRCTSV